MIVYLEYNDFKKNIDIDILKTSGKIQEDILNLCSLIIYNIEYTEIIINNNSYILGNNDFLFEDTFEKSIKLIISKIKSNNYKSLENLSITRFDEIRSDEEKNSSVQIKDNMIPENLENNQICKNIRIIIYDRKRDSNGNVIKENEIINKYNKWYQYNETETYINNLNNTSNFQNRNIIRYPLNSLLSSILSINLPTGNREERIIPNENSVDQINNSLQNNSHEELIYEDNIQVERNNEEILEENNLENGRTTSLNENSAQSIPTNFSINNIIEECTIQRSNQPISENEIENTLFEILNRNLNLDNIINDANWISENLLNEDSENNINFRESRLFNRYFNRLNNNMANHEIRSNIGTDDSLQDSVESNEDNIIQSNNNLDNTPENNNSVTSGANEENNNLDNNIYDDLPELIPLNTYNLNDNLYTNNFYINYTYPPYLNNSTINSSFYSNISIFNTFLNEPFLTQEDVIVALTEEQFNNLEHKNYKEENNELVDNDENIKIKECFICMEDFIESVEITKIKCNHVFHKECIKPWLCKQSTKCPICRIEVDKGTPILNNIEEIFQEDNLNESISTEEQIISDENSVELNNIINNDNIEERINRSIDIIINENENENTIENQE
jgi:hypothetical protein